MRRLVLLLVALLAAYASFASCGSTSAQRGPAVVLAPPAVPEITPLEPAPALAMRAFAMETRGRAPEARLSIARELAGLIRAARSGRLLDDSARADAVVAAWQWRALARERERWVETERWTKIVLAEANGAVPELEAVLQTLRAESLQHLGRVEEARAITRALGHVTDWRIIGPFDNERGKGWSKQEKPEEELDFAATYTGKARAVAWRSSPVADHPRGVVDVGALLRPSTQSFAYLATAVRSENGEECVLRVASRGPVKVFVNGREALARKVVRPFTFDQDRTVVALQPGWNRVLVKSCIEEQDEWAITARFTTLDGRPLALPIDSERAVDAPPASVKAKEKAAPEAREILEARAKEDPIAARELVLFHLIVHPEDRSAKHARKAAEAAVKHAPDDVDGLYLSALANAPDDETSREEMEVNPWILPLKRVVELDARHVAARIDLAHFALDLNPTLARADAWSAEALALAPEDPNALWQRRRVLSELGRDGEAGLLGERLLASAEHAWTRSGVAERAQALLLRGDRDGELALLRAGFAVDRQTGDSLDMYLGRLVDRGDVAELTSVIESVATAAPFQVAFRTDAAWRNENLGELDRARTHLEAARVLAPEDTGTLLALAKLEQRAGRVDVADAVLAESLRIDPNQDVLRRQREYLARSTEERFETPFLWDAREVLAAAPPVDRDEPLVLLARTEAYLVNRDGTSSRYEHRLWRVQNEGGAKELANYWIFYPYGGSLVVKNLRVLRADGSVEPVPAPRRGDQAWGNGNVRGFELSPLRIGDALDVEYRVEDSVPSVFGNYFGLRHDFYPDRPDPLAPTLRSELIFVTGPDVELHFTERNATALEKVATTDTAGRNVRRWTARDLPRPKPEGAMPDKTEFAPIVDATTFESWQAFAAWWWSFIEKEFEITPAMKDKVAELTRGLATEEEKIRALVRFVGQEIRYNAWSFGTHGYEPYSAPTIFERRFGDCKDKSILLATLLAEIQVHAHPVLINARYRQPDEPIEAALVEHFNHCIAYVPASGDRPGMYLDCTADLNPIEYLRADDQGARVLHVDRGAGSVHAVPYAHPAENQLARRYEIELDLEGDGDVKLVDTSNGAFGVGLRTNYGGEKGDIQKRLERDLRESFAQIAVREVETSAMEDLAEPPRLTARFQAKKLWATDGGGATLRLAFDGLGLSGLASEPRDARVREIVLDRPFAHEQTIVYRLPEGARVRELPPLAEIAADGLVSYRQEVSEKDGTVEVRRRFELVARRIAIADYARFQDALRAIELSEQRTLRIETTPAGGR